MINETLVFVNRLKVPVNLTFREIDCADWYGRSPAASSPIEIPAADANGFGGTRIVVNPSGSSSWNKWTADVSISEADGSNAQVESVRLAYTECPNTACDGGPGAVGIYTGNGFEMNAEITLKKVLGGGVVLGASGDTFVFVKY